MKKYSRLLLVVVAVLATAACSGDSKVGTDVDTDIAADGNQRLGETTTTVASGAPTDTAPTTAAPTTAPPTTARPVQTTAAPQAFDITIDEAGFTPQNVRVYAGQQVRFSNKDAESRSVNASDNSFRSGEIKPGGSWIFSTSRPGRYDIVDGTRPFVVGVIEVLAR